MKFSIITLFPEVFDPILNTSILKRAQKKGLVSFELVNLRDLGEGTHKVVDDRPYGGGAGMVLRADILSKALKSLTSKLPTPRLRSGQATNYQLQTILMSASGIPYKQSIARKFSKLDHLVLICGHYEGVDQRFIDKYVDMEISIGDFVLTGGEIPAMTVVDSITRLIPGVLEKPQATLDESFSDNLLEYPHYTRPEEFEGKKVPKVLLSGNHQKIQKWRAQKALGKTKKVRPDLLLLKGV